MTSGYDSQCPTKRVPIPGLSKPFGWLANAVFALVLVTSIVGGGVDGRPLVLQFLPNGKLAPGSEAAGAALMRRTMQQHHYVDQPAKRSGVKSAFAGPFFSILKAAAGKPRDGGAGPHGAGDVLETNKILTVGAPVPSLSKRTPSQPAPTTDDKSNRHGGNSAENSEESVERTKYYNPETLAHSRHASQAVYALPNQKGHRISAFVTSSKEKGHNANKGASKQAKEVSPAAGRQQAAGQQHSRPWPREKVDSGRAAQMKNPAEPDHKKKEERMLKASADALLAAIKEHVDSGKTWSAENDSNNKRRNGNAHHITQKPSFAGGDHGKSVAQDGGNNKGGGKSKEAPIVRASQPPLHENNHHPKQIKSNSRERTTVSKLQTRPPPTPVLHHVKTHQNQPPQVAGQQKPKKPNVEQNGKSAEVKNKAGKDNKGSTDGVTGGSSSASWSGERFLDEAIRNAAARFTSTSTKLPSEKGKTTTGYADFLRSNLSRHILKGALEDAINRVIDKRIKERKLTSIIHQIVTPRVKSSKTITTVPGANNHAYEQIGPDSPPMVPVAKDQQAVLVRGSPVQAHIIVPSAAAMQQPASYQQAKPLSTIVHTPVEGIVQAAAPRVHMASVPKLIRLNQKPYQVAPAQVFTAGESADGALQQDSNGVGEQSYEDGSKSGREAGGRAPQIVLHLDEGKLVIRQGREKGAEDDSSSGIQEIVLRKRI